MLPGNISRNVDVILAVIITTYVTLPVYDVTLPVYDVTLPVYDVTLPVYDVTLPVYDVTLPVYDVTLYNRRKEAWRVCSFAPWTSRL